MNRSSGIRTRIDWTSAGTTLVATIASFLTMGALGARAGAGGAAAILSAILTVTLARRAHDSSPRGLLLGIASLAATALAASGVAALLRASPPLGASVFTAGIFLSIWLRNFGERERRIGASIALPLVAILVVPVRIEAPGGPLVDVGLVAAAGIVPLLFITLVQDLARRAGVARDAVARAPEERRPAAGGGLSVATRMALQMAIGLAAAFALGFALFPGHWGWCVLSAFIVGSGARGRGDAAYKGVLRLLGALAGTLAAAACARVWTPNGPSEAAAIFVLLFAALALRRLNYAYWAAGVTLILAFLTRSGAGLPLGVLSLRLVAILAGALCAVASAWFVLPIRTESVVRRRLAHALQSLDDLLAHAASSDAERAAKRARFEHHLDELADVGAPVRWHRRLFARTRADHPARWIDLADDLREPVGAFDARAELRERRGGTVRRAVGAARRSIASHGKPDAPSDRATIEASLGGVREALTAHERR